MRRVSVTKERLFRREEEHFESQKRDNTAKKHGEAERQQNK
jgi:hypothetical protein